MSVRAYRVNKKELADGSSFNCWHQPGILDFFEEHNFWDGRNFDGCGIIEVSVETLEKLLNEYEWDKEDCEVDDYRESIAEDIAWAKKRNDSYVQYDCF